MVDGGDGRTATYETGGWIDGGDNERRRLLPARQGTAGRGRGTAGTTTGEDGGDGESDAEAGRERATRRRRGEGESDAAAARCMVGVEVDRVRRGVGVLISSGRGFFY